MGEILLTVRQIGEVGIKLLGVYFAASALLAAVGMLASLALPSVGGVPYAAGLTYSALSLLGLVVVAVVCLAGGESIARRVFVDDAIDAPGLSRQDLLMVGVALLGVGIALSGVPGLIQAGVTAIWYAEGSRQLMFWPAMQQSSQVLADSAVTVVVGSAAAMFAGRVAAAIDARPKGSHS